MPRDAYRDIGGRKCQEHIFEDTTARMQELERIRRQSRGVRSGPSFAIA